MNWTRKGRSGESGEVDYEGVRTEFEGKSREERGSGKLPGVPITAAHSH